MPGAATLKQAKAAHKAKGRSNVSEQELRHLQREIQLDHRAWALKEREKNKAIAKKQDTPTRRDRLLEEAKFLATQRRVDRFGHKSSQFHLGAFFTKPKMDAKVETMTASCSFGDDVFDDEDSVAALQAIDERVTIRRPSNDRKALVAGPSITNEETITKTTDLDDDMNYEDFLDSSSQLERELGGGKDDDDYGTSLEDCFDTQPTSFGSSFSHELTADEIAELDPVSSEDELDEVHDTKDTIASRQTNSKGSTDNEFSNTQLEKYVDEDIVLTQI